jgi:uracil-DNA glycosylase family 4
MKKVIKQYLEQLKYSGIKEIYHTKPLNKSSISLETSSLEKSQLLITKEEEYKDCKNCQLWTGRNRFVYGEGNPDAVCMVIGEGPGAEENIQGRPFVGKAGQLLDKMLLAIKIQRGDVYIANIVKCRPPNNRDPEQSERLACLPYLMEQIEIIQPRIFLLMGRISAQTLLETNKTMQEMRSRIHTFLDRPAYVTYHPSALLRNPEWKKPAWEDLQKFQLAYETLLKGDK